MFVLISQILALEIHVVSLYSLVGNARMDVVYFLSLLEIVLLIKRFNVPK